MPGLSEFPTAIDTYTTDEDGVTTIHADDVNEARDFAIAAQTKAGADGDALSAATLEGRAKYQEAGGLKRGGSVASATSITLTDAAQVFPVTGAVTIATIAAPSYPRLVLLEFASALTLEHGGGNLTLPGAVDMAVPAGAVLALEWTGATWRIAGGASSGDASSLQGTPVDATPPETGEVLAFDGDNWAPADLTDVLPADPVAGTPGLRTLGAGHQQAVAGDDGRLSNARTPTAHATSHVTVGGDPLPAFNTTTRGVVPPPGGTPSGIRFLSDLGTWLDPAIAGGGMSDPMTDEDDLMIGDTPALGVAAPKRLAKGTDGQVVGVDPTDHHVKYLDPPPSAVFDVDQDGSVPGPGDDSDLTQFLRVDGAWASPSGGGGSVFSTSTDGLVPGPSGSEDDSSHVLAGDGTWLDTSTLGGGGGGGGGLLDFMPTLVPPVLSSLTKINENGSVPYTQVGSTVYVKCGSLEVFPQVRLLVDTAANPHWHFRALVLLSGMPTGALNVVLRDSSTGKFIGVRFNAGTTSPITWTTSFNVFLSPTSFSGGDIAGPIACPPIHPLWVHAMWDGTNMLFGSSADGADPVMLYTTTPAAAVAKGWTSGHTPDQYGIGLEGLNVPYNQHVRILSWEEIALP